MYFEGYILSPEDCEKKNPGKDLKTNICTFSNHSNTCAGDSGSAVAVPNNDGSVTLVGVHSFRNTPICLPGVVTFGTRVSSYLEWIKEADSKLTPN